MRRPCWIAVISTWAFASQVVAEPTSISGTKSAVWTNPSGGPSSGAGTAWLRFGEYEAGSLGWSGNASFATTSGSPFSFGIIWLTNGSSQNPPTQMTLSVALDLQTPNDEVPATFEFDAALLSSNPAGGGDLTFSVIPGQTATWNAPNGSTYSLEMLGLSDNWEWDGTANSAITASADCEDNQTYAWIYGRLSVDDPAVAHTPEPSALLLAGLGLTLLAGWRRFGRNRSN